MDTDDMPDIGDMPDIAPSNRNPASPNDVDVDDDDELEDLLEDAFETEAAEEMFKATEPQQVPPEDRPGPSSAPQAVPTPADMIKDLPRTLDGGIDIEHLNGDQRKAYNAALLALLTDEQISRYESFRRASLKDALRKLMPAVVGTGNPKLMDRTLIALAGVSKVFVGQLVEEARRVAVELGATGPLQPSHIHTAFQRLKERGQVEGIPPARPKMTL